MQHLDKFKDALAAHGLSPDGAVIYTGGAANIKRFHIKGDNGNRKNGWYWLDHDGDISFGAFGNWKNGLTKPWFSKNKKEFTDYDKKSIEKKKKEYAAQETIKHAATAERAKKLWNISTPCDSHPYGQKKQIQLRNVRSHHGKLFVPMFKDKQVVNIQVINRDGVKLFLKGGEFKGCYGYIAGSRERGIYVCEGYATAASIAEATGAMVVVAFNCGNLTPVAKMVREQNKTAPIIIAADNDKRTIGNPGLTAGRKASEAVGGKLVYPEFPADRDELTDFNDLHVSEGIAAVTDALTGESQENGNTVAVSIPAVNEEFSMGSGVNWKMMLIPGNVREGDYPFPYCAKSKLNVYLHMRNMHPIFSYNEFSDEVMIMKSPDWDYSDDFMPRPLREEDFFMVAAHLERYGLKTGKDTVFDVIIKIAKENTINPPRDFFESLRWDGVKRVDRWLTYFMGATEQPEEYLALVGSKWLIGGISRIFNPGCKFDSVLVLEGSQGVGKSNALRVLSTFNGMDYFIDSVGDIRNKDTIMSLQGKFIVEMPELASMRKADNEEMKAFVSRQIDEYRPPYGRLTVRRMRYFIIAGTTNETSDGYLTDSTGNRRYWPVRCGEIDTAALEEQKYQLWAEAVHRYKLGEKTWIGDDQIDMPRREQESRMQVDAWSDRIDDATGGLITITTDLIFEKLGLGAKDMNRINRTRIRTILMQQGWYETKKESRRVWKRK